MENSGPDMELQLNDQPATEEAMITYINDLNVKLGEVTIVTHWQIGQTINSFYKGKYGSNELGRISEATGIGRDTLAKACKFAKQYSKEQLEMLLKGNFIMSWHQIAQNLTVEPQKVIEVYKQAPDTKQFYNDIIKLKSPSEGRGKAKPSNIDEVKYTEQVIIIDPEPEESIIFEHNESDEAVDSVELAKAYEKELEMLKLENERLNKEILSRDAKITQLEKALSDVQREKEKYEDSYYIYMNKMDKIRKGLEDNVPARDIIEYIENGDDE